jgi:hypothetical protein
MTDPTPDDPAVRLIALAESLGLVSEDLDRLVRDAKGREACVLNNGGLAGQVRYLLADGGVDWLEGRLTRLAAECAEADPADPGGSDT